MKVRVLQIGARKSYAVPEALALTENIEKLCTDFYFDNAISRLVMGFGKRIGMRRAADNMAGRRCVSLNPKSVISNAAWGLRNRRRTVGAVEEGKKYEAYLQGGIEFAEHYSRLPLHDVDVVYGFSSASLEAFQVAREQNVLCVLDHETAPAVLETNLIREIEEEFREWLPYESSAEVSDSIQKYTERQLRETECADIVLCPSTFSKELAGRSGVPARKIRVIPFAAGGHILDDCRSRESDRKRRPLRVLFAGNDAIRKGLPILVNALRMLPSDRFHAKAAGNWTLSEYGWEQASEVLTPLGAVPRREMVDHYRWADVFVLPTFSDTMGVVILEAMSFGVPVIATTSSGGPDLILDGGNGFVVSPGSPTQIRNKLHELDCDRHTLGRLSNAAYEHSKNFGRDQYGVKLRAVLKAALRNKSSGHNSVSGNGR